MKCPMSNYVMERESGEDEVLLNDCFKEECAWWVKASQSCAMEAIPRIIGYLGSELKTIKEKMPTPPTIKK